MMDELKDIVSNIRNIRASRNIPQKETLPLYSPKKLNGLVEKMANCNVVITVEKPTNSSSFISGTTEYNVVVPINVEEELRKLEADLAHQQGFLRGVMAKLSNERFVANAKPEIVALEQKKKADAEARIAALDASINALKG